MPHWSLLKERGWVHHSYNGKTHYWRHPLLHWQWPQGDAVRLEREADAGMAQALKILGVIGYAT